MCINLSTMAMSAATAQEWGAGLQAGASVARALGDLAAGSTRAAMLRADAAGVRAQGQAKARRIRTAGAQAVGESRAAAAASGVAVTGESVLDAERQAVRLSEQDAAMAILTGENQARGAEASADMYRSAGVQSALSELSTGASKWRLSKYAIDQQEMWRPGFDDTSAAYGGWTGQR